MSKIAHSSLTKPRRMSMPDMRADYRRLKKRYHESVLSIAFHEAAHAVAAVRFQHYFERVWAANSEHELAEIAAAGRSTIGECWSKDFHTTKAFAEQQGRLELARDDACRVMAVTHAGPVIDAILNKRPSWAMFDYGGGGDLRRISEVAEEMQDDTYLLRDAAYRAARKVIREFYWPIRELALQLVAERHVDFNDAPKSVIGIEYDSRMLWKPAAAELKAHKAEAKKREAREAKERSMPCVSVARVDRKYVWATYFDNPAAGAHYEDLTDRNDFGGNAIFAVGFGVTKTKGEAVRKATEAARSLGITRQVNTDVALEVASRFYGIKPSNASSTVPVF